jgi:hypothetical protein
MRKPRVFARMLPMRWGADYRHNNLRNF